MVDPPKQPTNSSDQPSPAKKKGQKKALSCEPCRRRKLKCDRGWPCGACRDRGEASRCEWAEGVQPQSAGRDAQDSTFVMDRLDRLEAMMGAIADNLGVNLPGQHSQRRQNSANAANQSNDAIGANATNTLKLSTLAELGAQEAHRVSLSRTSTSTPPSTSSPSSAPTNPNAVQAWTFGIGFSSLTQLSSEEITRRNLFQLLNLLPATKIVRNLATFYFDNLSWLAHVVPQELFNDNIQSHEELRLLWDGRPNSYTFQQMREALRFVALLHAFCASALVFGDPEDMLSLEEKDGKPPYSVYLDSAQQALSVLDIYEDLSIDNVRTMLLISTCLSALKNPAFGCAMLSNISFLAYQLQLDCEPPSYLSYQEKQDRILLFATICITDWFGAATIKRIYSIDPVQVSLPSLFGPESETNGMVPLHTRIKLKLADLGRRASMRSRMSDQEAYAETEILHRELVALEASIPPDLSYDGSSSNFDTQANGHRTAIALGIEHQRMILHKRFYLQSWSDPRYTKSRKICFTTSMKVVEIFRNCFKWFQPKENATLAEQQALMGEGMRRRKASISRLWFFAQMTIVSSLVLVHFVSMLDTHPQEQAEWDTSELRSQIIQDLKFIRLLLQLLSSKSKLAYDGARVIQPPELNHRKRKAGQAGLMYAPSSAQQPPPHVQAQPQGQLHQHPGPLQRQASLHRMYASTSPSNALASPCSSPSPQVLASTLRPSKTDDSPLVACSAKSFDDIEALWTRQPWLTAGLPTMSSHSPPKSMSNPSTRASSSANLPTSLHAINGGLSTAPTLASSSVAPSALMPVASSYHVQVAPTTTSANAMQPQNTAHHVPVNSNGNGYGYLPLQTSGSLIQPTPTPWFFGPDSSFGDIAAAEALIDKQDPSFLQPVAPASPFTSAFITSLDQYLSSIDDVSIASAVVSSPGSSTLPR